MNGHAAEVIVEMFVLHAVEVVGIKVYMIADAIGAVAIITNVPGNKIGVIYGVLDGKMSMTADVLDGKTATASKLNTGHFAKRTPGITHVHLVKSMGGSAERTVGDGAGGVVGVISIIAASSSAPPPPSLRPGCPARRAAGRLVQPAPRPAPVAGGRFLNRPRGRTVGRFPILGLRRQRLGQVQAPTVLRHHFTDVFVPRRVAGGVMASRKRRRCAGESAYYNRQRPDV
jgi:hypothetical protein